MFFLIVTELYSMLAGVKKEDYKLIFVYILRRLDANIVNKMLLRIVPCFIFSSEQYSSVKFISKRFIDVTDVSLKL